MSEVWKRGARVSGVSDGARTVPDGKVEVWVDGDGISFVPRAALAVWVPYERFHPVERRYTGMRFRIDGRTASVGFLRRRRVAIGVAIALVGPLAFGMVAGLLLGVASAVGMVDPTAVVDGVDRFVGSTADVFLGLLIRGGGAVMVVWEVLRAGGLASEFDEQVETGRRWVEVPLIGVAA